MEEVGRLRGGGSARRRCRHFALLLDGMWDFGLGDLRMAQEEDA